MEEIRQHLLHKLRVDEAEVEDGVELWREICGHEGEAREDKNGRAIMIDDTGSFKSELQSVIHSAADLRRFEKNNKEHHLVPF